MSLLNVIILTHQEEMNLEHALRSLKGLDCEVFVVDSGSTDRTAEIAKAFGARIVNHAFENQAQQLNWALDTLPLTASWTLRLDADERLTEQLALEIGRVTASPITAAAGYLIKRRVYFWGRWIRFGGYYPTWLVRLWRTGMARSEEVWMDEHMVVTGRVGRLEHDFIDENHKGLTFWIDKHNWYSNREIMSANTLSWAGTREKLGDAVARKRFLKNDVYGRSPLFLRAIAYWMLRYFVLLGFLDGRAGFVFHFLQGLWYRLLIDAKLYELKLGQVAQRSVEVSAEKRTYLARIMDQLLKVSGRFGHLHPSRSRDDR
jgi:glycosyltransferase involved in cell wall biosynthesis